MLNGGKCTFMTSNYAPKPNCAPFHFFQNFVKIVEFETGKVLFWYFPL